MGRLQIFLRSAISQSGQTTCIKGLVTHVNRMRNSNMSGGQKYRCEILLPEVSPYRDYVQDLEWRPFIQPSTGAKGRRKRAAEKPASNYPMLTEDNSVMVGYFTDSNAISAFREAFGEKTYAHFYVTLRDGFGSTKVYELFDTERHLDKLIHKQLLRRSVQCRLSTERRREVGGVMRALDYDYMRILDGKGNLVFAQREAVYMLGSWGYDVDESRHLIKWPEWVLFTIDERKKMLSKVVKRRNMPTSIKNEAYARLVEVREEERKHLIEVKRIEREEYEKANPPINWRRIFHTAKDHYENAGIDFRTSANALGLIRGQFGNRSTEKMEAIVKARLTRYNKNAGANIDGEINARSLVRRACDGEQDAMIKLADILVSNAARKQKATQAQDTVGNIVEDEASEIPLWAAPEKALILKWSDAARNLSIKTPEGKVAHFIRSQIGRGELNVLLFDGELYNEVIEADLSGGAGFEIESFPFHMTLVRLLTYEGILGIAVFRWEDFTKSAAFVDDSIKARHGHYGMAYLLDEGGVSLDPDEDLRCAAEKLVTYLDCDNAHIETVYVDGGVSQMRKTAHNQQLPTEAEYVRGADMVTGTQVIVERERTARGPSESLVVRRAHFRRGYYARRRIGTREDWHYERRWIKPTFVHGSSSIVTERQVRRLVL